MMTPIHHPSPPPPPSPSPLQRTKLSHTNRLGDEEHKNKAQLTCTVMSVGSFLLSLPPASPSHTLAVTRAPKRHWLLALFLSLSLSLSLPLIMKFSAETIAFFS
ncbi:unnamed protein product [Arctogadus glacialis]